MVFFIRFHHFYWYHDINAKVLFVSEAKLIFCQKQQVLLGGTINIRPYQIIHIMLLGNIKAMARNMTKMLYLRFHDKISDNTQYLYAIIIHFANIFNIQDWS